MWENQIHGATYGYLHLQGNGWSRRAPLSSAQSLLSRCWRQWPRLWRRWFPFMVALLPLLHVCSFFVLMCWTLDMSWVPKYPSKQSQSIWSQWILLLPTPIPQHSLWVGQGKCLPNQHAGCWLLAPLHVTQLSDLQCKLMKTFFYSSYWKVAYRCTYIHVFGQAPL